MSAKPWRLERNQRALIAMTAEQRDGAETPVSHLRFVEHDGAGGVELGLQEFNVRIESLLGRGAVAWVATHDELDQRADVALVGTCEGGTASDDAVVFSAEHADDRRHDTLAVAMHGFGAFDREPHLQCFADRVVVETIQQCDVAALCELEEPLF